MASVGPPKQILTHSQKVCRLFKQAVRGSNDNYNQK